MDKRIDVPSVDREGVVYHVRPPTVAERASFQAAIIAEGGQEISKYRLLDALIEGVNALMPSDEDKEQREAYLARIDQHRADVLKAVEVYDQSDQEDEKVREDFLKAVATPKDIEELASIVSEHYQPYRRLVGEMAVYPQRAGIVAARMFLIGWSGLDEPFTRKLGRVEDSTLEPISPRDLAAIGAKVRELAQPSKATLGNSRSARGGSRAQEPSPVESGTPKKAPRQPSTAAGGAKSSE
ncbi:MAG TPA: hypothetical protein VNS22_18900 [Geminicoccus sp.]|uniref:hypothetical protein n=1 Tax=Geminicoccus sp. TaxID=2024832 RepID=UPI002C22ED8F|nr:hypothetical protein [Geminicoccus sp.]HWL70429.1 hypothetical protein [Geminicoccus sp.]